MKKASRKPRREARLRLGVVNVGEQDLVLAIDVFKKEYGNLRGFRQAWERLCLKTQAQCGKFTWGKPYQGDLCLLIKTAYATGNDELIGIVKANVEKVVNKLNGSAK